MSEVAMLTENYLTNKEDGELISKVLACFGKGAGRKEMKKQKLHQSEQEQLDESYQAMRTKKYSEVGCQSCS
jgi:hypothetical protein